MPDNKIGYEVRGRTAWLTIRREAQRNALDAEAIEQFGAALDRAEADPQVGVVCVTGAGERAFCSGADLMSTMGQGGALDAARNYARLLGRLAHSPLPLVARVNGSCVAGGLGLLLSCDIAYARAGTKFGTPEVNVGLFPLMIGALILRNVARKQAMEMMLTARMYSAEQAERMGLLTRVYPAEQFEAAVGQTLDEIGAKAPLALRMGRQAMAHIDALALEPSLDYLCDRLGALMQTEDAMEGLMAFLQKRQPDWKGR